MSTLTAAPAVESTDAAFEALYRAEYGRVAGIARRVLGQLAEAEDVAQDVFAELAQRSDRPGAGWLHAAAAHRALNALRTRKRRTVRETGEAALDVPLRVARAADADPLLAVLRDELRGDVTCVMRRLRARDATVLALRYGGELPHRDIAAAIGVPVSHVGTLIARAERAFLREARRKRPAPHWLPALTAVGLAAAAIIVSAAAPLRAYATAIIQALQPRKIVLFLIQPHRARDVDVFRQLYRVARVRNTLRNTLTPYVPTLAQARTHSGLPIRVPSMIPDGLAAKRTQYVEPAGAVTFTFDAARSLRSGVSLPRDVDGTSIEVALRPSVQIRYGHGRVRDRIAGIGEPTVVVDEIATPRVTVRGATLERVARWFAAEPSVSRDAARQMRDLTDPYVALPLAVQVDREHAMRVRIDGVDGYAVTSPLAGSSFVVWIKDGMAYAVGGTYPLDRVLEIAGSLR